MLELLQFLKPGSEATIRDGNPWWRNERIYNAAIRHQAFSAFSERGAYPIAQANPLQPWSQVADYNAPFGILVTRDETVASDDPRIVSIPLSSLLLLL